MRARDNEVPQWFLRPGQEPPRRPPGTSEVPQVPPGHLEPRAKTSETSETPVPRASMLRGDAEEVEVGGGTSEVGGGFL